MTERKVAMTATSEALAAIGRMKGLLETYNGRALAYLHELQEGSPFQLIVGAQPLFPPTQKGRLNLVEQDLEGIRRFYADSVLAGWWYTRTVALFDGDMLTELLETDQTNLCVAYEQFSRFLGNPVLIPFEKPYSAGETDILGCIFGFFGFKNNFIESGSTRQSAIMLLPLLRNRSTKKASFSSVTLSYRMNISPDTPMEFSKLMEDALKDEKSTPGIELYRHELFSKIAYLLTETPDVMRCVSVRSPKMFLPRKKPARIVPPDTPRFRALGEEFGSAIRKYKADVLVSLSAAKGTVRPHLRRAHWHTYLTGKGRVEPKLKWVLPILVKSADFSAK